MHWRAVAFLPGLSAPTQPSRPRHIHWLQPAKQSTSRPQRSSPKRLCCCSRSSPRPSSTANLPCNTVITSRQPPTWAVFVVPLFFSTLDPLPKSTKKAPFQATGPGGPPNVSPPGSGLLLSAGTCRYRKCCAAGCHNCCRTTTCSSSGPPPTAALLRWWVPLWRAAIASNPPPATSQFAPVDISLSLPLAYLRLLAAAFLLILIRCRNSHSLLRASRHSGGCTVLPSDRLWFPQNSRFPRLRLRMPHPPARCLPQRTFV